MPWKSSLKNSSNFASNGTSSAFTYGEIQPIYSFPKTQSYIPNPNIAGLSEKKREKKMKNFALQIAGLESVSKSTYPKEKFYPVLTGFIQVSSQFKQDCVPSETKHITKHISSTGNLTGNLSKISSVDKMASVKTQSKFIIRPTTGFKEPLLPRKLKLLQSIQDPIKANNEVKKGKNIVNPI